jgi:hypothetical protein
LPQFAAITNHNHTDSPNAVTTNHYQTDTPPPHNHHHPPSPPTTVATTHHDDRVKVKFRFKAGVIIGAGAW